jgi:hypothetical protein
MAAMELIFSAVMVLSRVSVILLSSGIPRNFVQGRVQQIQLRTEGRENENLGAVAP